MGMEKKRTVGGKKKHKGYYFSATVRGCMRDYTGHSQPPPPVIKALVIKRAGRDMFLKQAELVSGDACFRT